MIYDSFPQKLKELTQWIVWKFQEVKGTIKPTKVPYKSVLKKASSTKPDDWMSFDDCKKLFETNKFDGLGFVFKKGYVMSGLIWIIASI